MRACAALLALIPLAAAADAPGLDWTARGLVEAHEANGKSPLAPAAALTRAGRDCASAQAWLRGRWAGLSGEAQAWQRSCTEGEASHEVRVDELYWEGAADGTHLSLGRKVLSWDVGYAFRPLDVVQREDRRALIDSPLQGVPMILVEHFGEHLASSLVLANPGREAGGRNEEALAWRGYLQRGSTDLHLMGRWGRREKASFGAAFASVPGEAWELHGSARWAQSLDDGARSGGGFWQALAGAQWTGQSKISLLSELWYDGSAPADSAWRDWQQRNALLATLPAGPRAGALADSANALARSTLRRLNLMLRASYGGESWTPAIDWVLTPADHGSVLSASLAWQGDRLKIEGGLRSYFGPGGALFRQLPERSIVYAGTTLSF